MANEKKTISQKLHKASILLEDLADWFDNYKKWRESFLATTDEGGNPGGPPPPPPPGDDDGE